MAAGLQQGCSASGRHLPLAAIRRQERRRRAEKYPSAALVLGRKGGLGAACTWRRCQQAWAVCPSEALQRNKSESASFEQKLAGELLTKICSIMLVLRQVVVSTAGFTSLGLHTRWWADNVLTPVRATHSTKLTELDTQRPRGLSGPVTEVLPFVLTVPPPVLVRVYRPSSSAQPTHVATCKHCCAFNFASTAQLILSQVFIAATLICISHRLRVCQPREATRMHQQQPHTAAHAVHHIFCADFQSEYDLYKQG